MTDRAYWISMLALLSGLLGLQFVSLGLGSVPVSFQSVVAFLRYGEDSGLPISEQIILGELRMPRILLAALVGAGLAGAGAAYQGLFRNPLADPFVIGASSGAALGAALAVVAGLTWSAGGFQAIPLAAFVGTFGAVLLVFSLGGVGAQSSALTLLLAGAAVSTILSAAVSFLMLVDDQSMRVIFSWLLGGFSGRSWQHLQTGTPYILGGLVFIQLLSRRLDALSLGEESARTLGMSLFTTRILVVAAASLTTAAAVSLAGVIGFVGLLAPHAARLMFGGNHVRLIPASALLGAILLVVADNLARMVLAPVEVPVGIVMALAGGPFFLYLLKTRIHTLGGTS